MGLAYTYAYHFDREDDARRLNYCLDPVTLLSAPAYQAFFKRHECEIGKTARSSRPSVEGQVCRVQLNLRVGRGMNLLR